jgi:hypothetical protein
MKQYRITSQNFVHQGESGYDDAVMDPAELTELKRLAGLPIAEQTGMISMGAGTVGGNLDNVPNSTDTGITSPLGTVQRDLATERRQLEAEYGAKTGTDLWFILNFTKPTEKKTLRDYAEEYLTKHPEYRPKTLPSLGS